MIENIKVYQKMIALFPKVFLEFILILSVLLIIYFYNYNSNLNNAAVVIGIFGYSSLRLLPQLLFIYKFFNKINYSKHSAQVIYDELKEMSFSSENLNKESKNKYNFIKFIKLEKISFRSININNTLNNINFNIEKNKTYGIKGESGSGKQHINILMGIHHNCGKIYLDDNEVH